MMQHATPVAPSDATVIHDILKELDAVFLLVGESESIAQVIYMAAGALDDMDECEALRTVLQDLQLRLAKAFSTLRVLNNRCSSALRAPASEEGGAT